MDDDNNSPLLLERRHITVLECDLVGSTPLAHKLDPEKLRDLLLAFQDCVLSEIEKQDGHFAQFAGDAVWAYFGYPKAHEDDAIRAVRAGLDIVQKVSDIHLHNETLSARVGIASGLCVVGNLRQSPIVTAHGNHNYVTAIGDPPNIAARIQTLVTSGSVAISNETHSLTGNLFKFEELGFHELKGFVEKKKVWKVLDKSEELSRYIALRPPVKSPIIGRDTELETMGGLWEQARKNRGQVVYLTGDPGIGKSRLVASVAEDIVGNTAKKWWIHCNENLQSSAFAPIIAFLRELALIKDGDDISVQIDKLSSKFLSLDHDSILILSDLLSAGQDSEIAKSKTSSFKRRENLDEVLLNIFSMTCAEDSLLIIFEDTHWIDPSTSLFLEKLVRKVSNSSTLVLITQRKPFDFVNASSQLFHVNYFHIDQLQKHEAFSLLKSIWQENKLPENLAEEIVVRTDGVPLFIEDFAISQLSVNNPEDNLPAMLDLSIPATLNEHLMSRLDSLGENKRIAQIASVVGIEFTASLIAALTGINIDLLDGTFLRIVKARIFDIETRENDCVYSFTHSLMREAAYSSLLISDRKELHGKIAIWLINKSPAIRQSQPELIAYHFQRAEAYEDAIAFWLEAGKRAKSRSNYAEAASHLDIAYELVGFLDSSDSLDQIKLDIKTTKAASEAGAFGISSDGCGLAYEEARALCRKLGFPDDIFPVLSGAGSFHFLRGNYSEVREIANELLELASKKSNVSGAIIGNRLMGAVDFASGNLDSAITLLRTAINIYEENPKSHQSRYIAYSMDQKTSSLCYLALTYLVKGEDELALSIGNESLEHSRTLDLHSLNYALCYLAGLHYFRGDSAEINYSLSSKSYKLSVSEGFPSWTGMSRLIMGDSMIRMGKIKAGFREVEQGVEEHSNVAALSFLPFAQSVSAKAFAAIGEYDKASRILIKAETLTRQTQQNWYLPEIQRLQAEILDRLNRKQDAKEYYQKAMASAVRIGAEFWIKRIQESMLLHGIKQED
ncbi:MAG: AAA family ATPase [Gammaproteobacteria bacterium]|nr:AAA family ATPase [Gammaproteobacteria bacterium]